MKDIKFSDIVPNKPAPATGTPEQIAYMTELRAMPIEERRQKAYELRLSGRTLREIAELFGVTQGTVSTWITKYNKTLQEAAQDSTFLGLYVDNITFLEAYEKIAVTMAQGEEGSKSERDRISWLQLALKTRQTMIDMQAKVGVLPTDPNGLFGKLENPQAAAETKRQDERTDEEIKGDIDKLFKHGRTL